MTLQHGTKTFIGLFFSLFFYLEFSDYPKKVLIENSEKNLLEVHYCTKTLTQLYISSSAGSYSQKQPIHELYSKVGFASHSSFELGVTEIEQEKYLQSVQVANKVILFNQIFKHHEPI